MDILDKAFIANSNRHSKEYFVFLNYFSIQFSPSHGTPAENDFRREYQKVTEARKNKSDRFFAFFSLRQTPFFWQGLLVYMGQYNAYGYFEA